jgi:hypothetical protein
LRVHVIHIRADRNPAVGSNEPELEVGIVLIGRRWVGVGLHVIKIAHSQVKITGTGADVGSCAVEGPVRGNRHDVEAGWRRRFYSQKHRLIELAELVQSAAPEEVEGIGDRQVVGHLDGGLQGGIEVDQDQFGG